MNIDTFVERLTEVADQNSWLQMYREDLTVHDRRSFEQLADWRDFWWLVGDTFTHMGPVGFHDRCTKMARAAIEARQSASSREIGLYRLDPVTGRMTRVALDRGLADIAAQPCFVVERDGRIMKCGTCWGRLELDWAADRQRHRTVGVYRYHADGSRSIPESWAAQLALSEATDQRGLWISVYHADDYETEAA